ncbi:MAG: ATP-binding protein [Chlamydiae bacterium]|nr:ATP-binding protein [Chlamydiota bacterium]MBI3276958.1 ATP-binding protein [Chlamydiota bacterium]
MREILLSQKKERDTLLQKPTTARESLIQTRQTMDNQLIKVVIGPRRSGKSTFAIQLLREKNFSYINFDDERLQNITDTDDLLQNMIAVYGQTPFIFFDEIQNLPRWELLVNRLQRQGLRLIITGSNSQLLSGELATHLTGRYLEHTLLPFSFGEFLSAKKIDPKPLSQTKQDQGVILKHLDDFFLQGGFPEIVVDGISPSPYLKTLYENILFKDIVKRYKVRFIKQLSDLGNYLMTNHCGHMTYTSLMKFLNLKSVHTLQNFTEYLCRTYLIFLVNRFSPTLKTQIKSSKKVYGFDQGMIGAVKFQNFDDRTKILENIVAIELARRKSEFFYYFTRNNKEVDFLVKKGFEAEQLIQVCYDLTVPSTRQREIQALITASEEVGCNDLVILTRSQKGIETVEKKEVRLIPVWEWLLSSPSL